MAERDRTTEGSDIVPYLQLSQSLARGQSDLTFTFLKSNRGGLDAPRHAASRYGTWEAVVPPEGDRLAVTRTVMLPGSGQLLVEFTSVAGARYAIEYSSNLEQWTLVPGGRDAWRAAREPNGSTRDRLRLQQHIAETQRFYRVVLLGRGTRRKT